jgi:hypothetical protein
LVIGGDDVLHRDLAAAALVDMAESLEDNVGYGVDEVFAVNVE